MLLAGLQRFEPTLLAQAVHHCGRLGARCVPQSAGFGTIGEPRVQLGATCRLAGLGFAQRFFDTALTLSHVPFTAARRCCWTRWAATS